MNKENLLFLKDALKNLGFDADGSLNDQLEQSVSRSLKEFQIYTETIFEEDSKMEACLYFRRAGEHDLYFFNKYDALLRYPDRPGSHRVQIFFINKGRGITFKEAFNLLSGRAVYKEDLMSLDGEKYKAWLELKLEEEKRGEYYGVRQYRDRYGYNLEKVLEKYSIQELQQENTKMALTQSLKGGDKILVTFNTVSGKRLMNIEANPRYKTINIYPSPTKPSQQKDI